MARNNDTLSISPRTEYARRRARCVACGETVRYEHVSEGRCVGCTGGMTR